MKKVLDFDKKTVFIGTTNAASYIADPVSMPSVDLRQQCRKCPLMILNQFLQNRVKLWRVRNSFCQLIVDSAQRIWRRLGQFGKD